MGKNKSNKKKMSEDKKEEENQEQEQSQEQEEQQKSENLEQEQKTPQKETQKQEDEQIQQENQDNESKETQENTQSDQLQDKQESEKDEQNSQNDIDNKENQVNEDNQENAEIKQEDIQNDVADKEKQEKEDEQNQDKSQNQNQVQQNDSVQEEQKKDDQKQEENNNNKKPKRKIFDEINTGKPNLGDELSSNPYQTNLDKSVDVEHIKQYHNEKQQQIQQQLGTQLLNYSSTDPDYQKSESMVQSKVHTINKGLNPEELDEHSLINQAALNRKLENFNQLKEWDHQRADFLNTHRNLIESIIARVDQLAIMSTSHLEILIKYFSGKSRQEISYGRSPIAQPNALLDKHALSTNFTPYKEFSSLLSDLDKVSQNQMQKAQQFGTFIEKDILQEILLKDYDYQNQTMQKLRDQIINIKKQLSETNMSAQKKSARFSLIYHSQLPRQQGQKQLMPRINKDLYKKEIGFLRKAEQQREIQRELARATLEFWIQGNQFEIARVKIIQQALDLYTKAYQEYIGEQKDILTEQFFEKLRQEFTEDTAQELYGIRKILHEQEVSFVKSQLGKEEGDQLSFQELQKYFEKFVIQDFTERMLVLKDWNASREIMPGNYQECKIVVTVDKFIHCFDKTNQIDKFGQKISDQKFRKPTYSIYLNNAKYEPLEEGGVKLRVSHQKQMMFMKFLTPKDINIFKFKTNDQAEEFIQIIDTL